MPATCSTLLIRLLLVFSAAYIQAQPLPATEIDSIFAQQHFVAGSYPHVRFDSAHQWAIKTALMYYPELDQAHVRFKVKKSRSPLSARPTILSVLRRPAHRRYLVIISDQTNPRFEPILLPNLSFNAQVGVLGHELSHVADFQQRSGWWLVKLAIRHASKKYMDNFENQTDRRCIEHGLGYQMLDWSTEVRQKLGIQQWNGTDDPEGKPVRERYMSPASIRAVMDGLAMYK